MIQRLKNLKVKLQFTGWLQYIIPAILSLLFLLIAFVFTLVHLTALFYLFLGAGALIFSINIIDILTIKFNLRPRESLPKRRDHLNEFDLMRARTACRSFQNRLLIEQDKSELFDEIDKVLTSQDDNLGKNHIRFEYVNERITVWPVVGAQEFIVAIAPKKYNRLSVIDVGRKLQKIVHHATRMGLATCWIGPGADQSSIIKALGGKFDIDSDHIICVSAIGYKSIFKPFISRLATIPQHRRLPISKLFSVNEVTNPLDENLAPFNQFDRCYEVCQWAPSSFNNQPTRAIVRTNVNKTKVEKVDFYAKIQSRFYAPVALGIWLTNWEIGCRALKIEGKFTAMNPINSKETSNTLPIDVSWQPI